MTRNIMKYLVLLLGLLPIAASGQTVRMTVETSFRSGVLTLDDMLNSSLFRLTLTNNAAETASVYLRFELKREENNEYIMRAQTRPFNIAGQGERSFTNVSLLNAQDEDIQNEIFEFNEAAVPGLYETGKIPSGRFLAVLELFSATGVLNDRSEQLWIINIPSTVDPIYPGQAAQAGDCFELFSTRPRFLWNSTGDEFRLIICKVIDQVYADQTLNCGDIPSQRPVDITLRRGVDFDLAKTGNQFISINDLFSRPDVSVTELEEGASYIWQVIPTYGEPGPVWCFRVANLSGMDEEQLRQRQVMNILQAILGGEIYQDHPQLQGYVPTGILYKNEKIDVAALVEILKGVKIESSTVK